MIAIACDHAGLELKEEIIKNINQKNIQKSVYDMFFVE